MSDNTDRLRDFYAAVQGGEFDRAMAIFAPDVEIRTRLETHRGIDAVRKMLEEAFSEFDSALEIDEMTEPAPDTVVACYQLVMRGQYSNIDSRQALVDVARFQDGRVYSVGVFSDRNEAKEWAVQGSNL